MAGHPAEEESIGLADVFRRIWLNLLAERAGDSNSSISCDEFEALITQHLRIATAIFYVALAGELAATALL